MRLERVDSTNRFAAERAAAVGADGLVVVADEQLAGRGRRGRSWHAPAGAGLLCSVVLRLPGGSPDAHLGTAAVALAARAALGELCGLPATLKWPNDLVVAHQRGPDLKLAGVLAEWCAGGLLVVGIGCNLLWPASAGEPPPGATSVAAETGRAPRRDELLACFLQELAARYLPLRAGEPAAALALAAERRAASATIGRLVRVEPARGEPWRGRAVDVADDGRLVVTGGDGTRRAIAEGDVIHLRPEPD